MPCHLFWGFIFHFHSRQYRGLPHVFGQHQHTTTLFRSTNPLKTSSEITRPLERTNQHLIKSKTFQQSQQNKTNMCFIYFPYLSSILGMGGRPSHHGGPIGVHGHPWRLDDDWATQMTLRTVHSCVHMIIYSTSIYLYLYIYI